MNLNCRVTYRGYDESLDLISVIRYAKGRNGQTRPINLMMPFENRQLKRNFFEAVNEGAIRIGDEILLSLQRCSTEQNNYSIVTAWQANESSQTAKSGLLCAPRGELR